MWVSPPPLRHAIGPILLQGMASIGGGSGGIVAAPDMKIQRFGHKHEPILLQGIASIDNGSGGVAAAPELKIHRFGHKYEASRDETRKLDQKSPPPVEKSAAFLQHRHLDRSPVAAARGGPSPSSKASFSLVAAGAMAAKLSATWIWLIVLTVFIGLMMICMIVRCIMDHWRTPEQGPLPPNMRYPFAKDLAAPKGSLNSDPGPGSPQPIAKKKYGACC